MSKPEHRAAILAEHAWTTPPSYGGFDPIGHYCIATRTRDSSNLELSNWDEIRSRLERAGAEILQDGEGTCYDWRAGHWACGWVEYLMLAPNAPQALLDVGADCLLELEDYPILNEDDYSTREMNDIFEYWERCSMRERVQYCQENDVCIFAARHDEIPEAVENALRDSGSFA